MKRIIHKLARFLMRLLSSDVDVSSRRFTSLVALVTIVFSVIARMFKIEIPEFMFWGLVTICLTCLGLTTVKP